MHSQPLQSWIEDDEGRLFMVAKPWRGPQTWGPSFKESILWGTCGQIEDFILLSALGQLQEAILLGTHSQKWTTDIIMKVSRYVEIARNTVTSYMFISCVPWSIKLGRKALYKIKQQWNRELLSFFFLVIPFHCWHFVQTMTSVINSSLICRFSSSLEVSTSLHVLFC